MGLLSLVPNSCVCAVYPEFGEHVPEQERPRCRIRTGDQANHRRISRRTGRCRRCRRRVISRRRPPIRTQAGSLASILDGFVIPLPGVILAGIGAVIAFSGSEVTTYDDGSVSAEGGNPVGVIVMVVGILAIFLIEVWNLVFRQGNTGQTLGKKWLGISVIRESDGVPLGPVMALLRWIMMAILGGACFLNYLWPLWDSKHQCWHDMVVRSVVVRAR